MYFRSRFGPTLPVNKPSFPGGYEAQINSTARNRHRTGSLFVSGVDPPQVSLSESPVSPGQWFSLEVTADGNSVVIVVDGKTTAEWCDEKRRYSSGHVALEQFAPRTIVEFRKIEIREFNRSLGGTEADSRIPVKQFTNSIGMKLVLIPAGEFLMGSPDSDKDAVGNEKPQHRVRITRPFYLAATEVTRRPVPPVRR